MNASTQFLAAKMAQWQLDTPLSVCRYILYMTLFYYHSDCALNGGVVCCVLCVSLLSQGWWVCDQFLWLGRWRWLQGSAPRCQGFRRYPYFSHCARMYIQYYSVHACGYYGILRSITMGVSLRVGRWYLIISVCVCVCVPRVEMEDQWCTCSFHILAQNS